MGIGAAMPRATGAEERCGSRRKVESIAWRISSSGNGRIKRPSLSVPCGLHDDGAQHAVGFVGAADVFVSAGDAEDLPVAFAGVDAAGIEGFCAFGQGEVG